MITDKACLMTLVDAWRVLLTGHINFSQIGAGILIISALTHVSFYPTYYTMSKIERETRTFSSSVQTAIIFKYFFQNYTLFSKVRIEKWQKCQSSSAPYNFILVCQTFDGQLKDLEFLLIYDFTAMFYSEVNLTFEIYFLGTKSQCSLAGK